MVNAPIRSATSYESVGKHNSWTNVLEQHGAFFTNLDQFQTKGVHIARSTHTVQILLNAGQLRSKGVEFELEARR